MASQGDRIVAAAAPVKDLDSQLSDAVNLIAVLLVFVFAYFSAVWPQAQAMLDEDPDVAADRRRLANKHRGQRFLLSGLVVVVLVILGVLSPLTSDIVRAWSWHGEYHTLRAWLAVVDGLLLAVGVIAGRMVLRLRSRIRELEA
jgi:hypothetical protein